MSHLQPQDVVIAAFGRSAVGRAKKGSLRNTHPVDFGGQVLRQVLDKVPQLDPKDISDIIIGCSKCEEVQGYNIGRLICLRAGVPYDVPAQTVNRFCSSGLQTIYTAINMIRCGDAEVMVAGGVETMSLLPMGTKDEVRCRWIKENEPGAYMPMGITAENVAEACHITREEQDRMALESHQKAAAAQDSGKFVEQIVPVEALDDDGNPFVFDKDEGIRRGLTMEDLAKLKTVFKDRDRRYVLPDERCRRHGGPDDRPEGGSAGHQASGQIRLLWCARPGSLCYGSWPQDGRAHCAGARGSHHRPDGRH